MGVSHWSSRTAGHFSFSSGVVNEPICCLAAGHEGVNNPIVLARLSDEVLALSAPRFYSGKVYGE